MIKPPPSASLALLLVAVLTTAPAAARAGTEARLELFTADGPTAALSRATDVAIEVHGLIARTRVMQTFVNHSGDWVEGRYVFPLPAGATVDALRVTLGERVIEGVVREKRTAREAFAQARDTGRGAGLVERHRGNLFSTRLTHIAPGERVEVEIGFGQPVSYRHGEFRLRFPLATLPRYANQPGAPGTRETPVDPWTAAVSADPLPPMPAEPTGGGLRMRVAVHAGLQIAEIRSLHHDTRIDGRGSERTIEVVPGPRDHGRDFELVWRPVPSQSVRGALFVEPMHDRAHALLMLVPPADFRPAELRRELIVVLDRSGSMRGEAFEQARAAVTMALDRIGPDDRFNVIAFNGRAHALFDAPRPARAANLARAREFVAALAANGGTEIDAAVAHAIAGLPEPGYLRQIVFATDGAVANEAQVLARVDDDLGDARLFPVGIGHGVNDAFLQRLAERGRGTVTRIADPREVRGRMGELMVQLESPVLEDLQVDWPLAAETWPARLPDLYAGEPVVVRARLNARLSELGAGSVRINGLRGLDFVELEWPLSQLQFAPGVARAWAQARIDGLQRRDAMDPQLRHDEMLLTALDYGIVSPLTSLVAVDRTPRRSEQAALRRTEVAGTPPTDRSGAVLRAMPSTDAGSFEAGLRGLSILVIVLLVLFNRRIHRGQDGRAHTGRPTGDER